MRVGAENRIKLILACVLFAIAIFSVARMLLSTAPRAAAASSTPVATPPAGAAPRVAASGRVRRARAHVAPDNAPTASTSLDPRLRLDLLKQSEDTEYAGVGRNIFRAEAAPVIPKPVASPIKNGTTTAAAAAAPQGPPPPPPINLKFFGFANSPGEAARVFLSQGDDVFIAGEGDIVNRRYKVVHIGPNSVEVQDVFSNNRQTIPLTQG